jgi:hypothetical protein
MFNDDDDELTEKDRRAVAASRETMDQIRHSKGD